MENDDDSVVVASDGAQQADKPLLRQIIALGGRHAGGADKLFYQRDISMRQCGERLGRAGLHLNDQPVLTRGRNAAAFSPPLHSRVTPPEKCF